MNPTASQSIDSFFASFPRVSWKTGEAVIGLNQEPPGVIRLLEGTVIQYDISNSGQKIIINTFQPPAFFPMSWAVNGTPNIYAFEAATPVTAQVAPQAEALAFVRSNPDVLYDLLSRVYRGTDGLLRRLAHVLGGTATTTLLFELVVCCKRFGRPDGQGGYELAITEHELAARTGASRETVNRRLKDLSKQGMLRLSYRKVTVPDLSLLESALGSRL